MAGPASADERGKKMIIEVNEKGSKEFYEEVVNAARQYRYLIKNPERKLKNNFRFLRTYLVVAAVMLAIVVIMGISWGFDASTAGVSAALATVIALYVVYLCNYKKMLNMYLEDNRKSVVTLDEDGIEMNKEDGQIMRLSWENVAFARMFRESLCFFSKSVAGMIISVDRKHAAGILEFLMDNNIDIRYIEG